MKDEEDDGESKTRGGMFGVEARADGGGEIADDGFGDAVKAERDGGSAEAVLQAGR